MKHVLKFGWLLILTPNCAYADPWGSESLGDGIAIAMLTIVALIYSIIYLIVALISLPVKTMKKSFRIYNTLSFVLYLLFFFSVISYFIKHPKGWGQIITDGVSEGTLKMGWMNIVILIATFLSIYYLNWQLKNKR